MSTLKVNELQNVAGNSLLTSSGNTISGPLSQMSGFRNRIINGNMMIDQRYNGSSVTAATGYCVDRWSTNNNGSATYTQQQVSDAPAGFTNSLKVTVATAATLSSTQFCFTRQIIEGLNISDLAWGTASASPISVSFWVKSSIAGTYSAFFVNSAENRSYVKTFTISSANNWEQKSFTIPGDTTGTWLTTNSNGIRFGFDLGSGSNFNGTDSAWQDGWRQRTSGTVNFTGTSGATFFITGVQLERGSVATQFEFRSFPQELALCQRYFEKSYDYNTIPGTNTPVGFHAMNYAQGQIGNTAGYFVGSRFQVRKRAVPTVTVYSRQGNAGRISTGASHETVPAAGSGTTADAGEMGFSVLNGSGSTVTLGLNTVCFHWQASAEL